MVWYQRVSPGDGVGQRLFRDELGLAGVHDFEVVAVEMVEFGPARVEIFVQLADHLVGGGAIGVGQRFVDQHKPAIFVFGEDEAGVEVDHLAQKVALGFEAHPASVCGR